MSSHASRFVTTCQQLLVLGVICAVLTPAANVVSLELDPPSARRGVATSPTTAPLSLSAYSRAAALPAAVPDEVVDPVVREVPLTAPRGARLAAGALKAKASVAGGRSELVSDPQKVTGYGAVGVTWEHGNVIPDDEITFQVRTRDDGTWSPWTQMAYHDEHGPDAGTREAKRARPGTDELLIGDVDDVQVKIKTGRAMPADLKLAVIDPGLPSASKVEKPAIDTSALDEDAPQPPTDPTTEGDLPSTEGDLNLSAAKVTPKPQIFSRAQWGADEKLRDKGSLHYYEVHAGFVHHTVNANDYKAKDVPAILRGIYAYHTKSRGWADIGYNFLVDKFGRIWEGRYGGVDRPVVGAHTLGYNDYSFAMSAIGNFDIKQPPAVMIAAYGALFAWKLSLHGVSATAQKQWLGGKAFQAINGHRDAGSTACPGKYLYAKLPQIRQLARAAQVNFKNRQLESNLASTKQPDLVLRRKRDGQGIIVPLLKTKDGIYKAGRKLDTGVSFAGANKIMNVGDWDRDGKGDVLARFKDELVLFRGLGKGKLAPGVLVARGFKQVGLLAAVGDMTGDGYPDLMGQPKGGSMYLWPGNGLAGLQQGYVARGSLSGNFQIGVGLWNQGGAPDTLLRQGAVISMYKGNGPGGLSGAPQQLGLNLAPFNWVIGISDIDLTGHPDLVVRRRKGGALLLIKANKNQFGTPIRLGTRFNAFDLAG